MVVDIVDCPSETNVVHGAVDTVLWRKDIEKLSEGELWGDIVWKEKRRLGQK